MCACHQATCVFTSRWPHSRASRCIAAVYCGSPSRTRSKSRRVADRSLRLRHTANDQSAALPRPCASLSTCCPPAAANASWPSRANSAALVRPGRPRLLGGRSSFRSPQRLLYPTWPCQGPCEAEIAPARSRHSGAPSRLYSPAETCLVRSALGTPSL
jgi:hypothetical protein